MPAYIVRRLLSGLLMLFAITLVTFAIFRLIPLLQVDLRQERERPALATQLLSLRPGPFENEGAPRAHEPSE